MQRLTASLLRRDLILASVEDCCTEMHIMMMISKHALPPRETDMLPEVRTVLPRCGTSSQRGTVKAPGNSQCSEKSRRGSVFRNESSRNRV
jgi:hypothetical protein